MNKIRLGPMNMLEFRKNLSWGHCYFQFISLIFADDISLFSVHDVNVSAELDGDLKKIDKWTFQCRKLSLVVK